MPSIVEISEPDDPRIAAFRNIRERDLAREGGFIAEGTVVLESLLRSPFFEARSLLILRNRLAGLSELLENVSPGVPIHVAERPVLDAVAGFPMHRGVVALGVRRAGAPIPVAERLAAAARNRGVVVAAVGIANHDNIGGIFRNAAAFAADMVLVDETSCDPLYRKAIRVSAGAVLAMPFERLDRSAIVETLRRAGFRLCALSPGGRRDVDHLSADEPTALLLGSEGEGLPADLLRSAETVRIDMAPGFDSLNVATSAAIALHRLHSARRAAASVPASGG